MIRRCSIPKFRSPKFLGPLGHPGVSHVARKIAIPLNLTVILDLPHRTLARYLRAFASFHGANSNDKNSDIAYNTRVELVEKRYDDAGRQRGWKLTLKRLERDGQDSAKATWWTEVSEPVLEMFCCPLICGNTGF